MCFISKKKLEYEVKIEEVRGWKSRISNGTDYLFAVFEQNNEIETLLVESIERITEDMVKILRFDVLLTVVN